MTNLNSRILIVDDEADIRHLVKDILEDEGFSTRDAHDADTALAASLRLKANTGLAARVIRVTRVKAFIGRRPHNNHHN